MKYSVIIPHYNSQESLIRCIRSIPNGDQYQIIVIDDCSPDTVDFDQVRKVVNRSIEVEVLASNSGAGAARNLGLKLAKGEWVIFSDSDDYFLPMANEVFENATNNTQTDIIVFNIDDKCNDSLQGKRFWNLVKNYDGTEKATNDLKYRSWAPWAKLFRRKFIENNGLYFECRRKGNDCFFVLNAMAKARHIDVFDEPVYHLTYSQDSLSHTNTKNWKYMYDVYDLWLWRYRFYKDNAIPLWKEYNLYYLLKEVYKKFNIRRSFEILLRSRHYRYSITDLLISKLTK